MTWFEKVGIYQKYYKNNFGGVFRKPFLAVMSSNYWMLPLSHSTCTQASGTMLNLVCHEYITLKSMRLLNIHSICLSLIFTVRIHRPLWLPQNGCEAPKEFSTHLWGPLFCAKRSDAPLGWRWNRRLRRRTRLLKPFMLRFTGGGRPPPC